MFTKDCGMGGQASDSAVIARRSPTRVAYCDASLPADLVDFVCTRPESLVTRGKLLRHVGARQTVRLEWASRQFVLKHYGEQSRWHALKRWGRHSRSWSTWKVMHKLADAGIRTPRPVACIENRWGPLRRDSFLMYPYVEGRTLRAHFENQTDEAHTAGFWQQLHDLWQRLRQLRVSLTDTNLSNFIVCETGLVWAVDLDGTRVHRSAYLTAHYQRRAWNRLLRSAATAKRRADQTAAG